MNNSLILLDLDIVTVSGLFGAVDVNLNIALTPALEKAKTFSLK